MSSRPRTEVVSLSLSLSPPRAADQVLHEIDLAIDDLKRVADAGAALVQSDHGVGGAVSVLGRDNALDFEFAQPDGSHPVDIVPAHGGGELLSDAPYQDRRVEAPALDVSEVGKADLWAAKHALQPDLLSDTSGAKI